MGKENSKRIQTSILNNAEKKVLVWLAGKQPAWMNSDIMTGIGVFGAVLYMLGGYLSNANLNYLWLASFGLVLHWYGDSLDGTLARVRHEERPVFGFFIDLNVSTSFVGADGFSRDVSEVVYGASVLLFGGLGLIIAFVVEMRLDKGKDKRS